MRSDRCHWAGFSEKKAQRAGRAAPPSPASDRWLAYGTLPLRFFLGLTFLYAGVLLGPALTPLPPIRIQEGSDGNVYAG